MSHKFNCSFCGKHQDDAFLLVAGLNAFICEACIATCSEILQCKRAGEAEYRSWTNPT